MKTIIGVTGHIGSGKDTVCDILVAQGYHKKSIGLAVRQECYDIATWGGDWVGYATQDDLTARARLLHQRRMRRHITDPADKRYWATLVPRACDLMMADPFLHAQPSWESWLAYVEAHKRDPAGGAAEWTRLILQGWAMYRRDVCEQDYWIARVWLEPGVCVCDVRFQQETDAIHDKGGVVWRITRPGCDGNGQATEVCITSLSVDKEISNDGDLDALRARVLSAVAELEVI